MADWENIPRLDPALQDEIDNVQLKHNALVEAVRGYSGGSIAGKTNEVMGTHQGNLDTVAARERSLLSAIGQPEPTPSMFLDFASQTYFTGIRGLEQAVDPHKYLTVERATPKWVMGPQGKLVEVPPNKLACEYDPVTGEPQGVLIEESRTNYISLDRYGTQRQEILEMVDSPLPGHPARRVAVTETGSTYSYSGAVELTSGQTIVHSIYAKATETNSIVTVGWFGGATRAIPDGPKAIFDLSSGAVTSVDATAIDSGIEPAGGGWYRCWVSAEATQDGDAGCCVWLDGGVGAETIWGLPQAEKDATRPSSYIPVTDAPATRAADEVSRELGEEFNPNEGTVFVEYMIPAFTTTTFAGAIGDSASNYIGVGYNPTSGQARNTYFVVDGANYNITHGQLGIEYGQWVKYAVSFRAGSAYTVATNGSSTQGPVLPNDLSGVARELWLGSRFGTYRSPGIFATFRYYPHALSEQELEELTANG